MCVCLCVCVCVCVSVAYLGVRVDLGFFFGTLRIVCVYLSHVTCLWVISQVYGSWDIGLVTYDSCVMTHMSQSHIS